MVRAYIVAVVLLTCALSARYGSRRRAANRPLSARDTIALTLTIVAIDFPLISLPALVSWGRHATWPDVVTAAGALLVLSSAPLGVFLLTRAVLRAVAPDREPRPAGLHRGANEGRG